MTRKTSLALALLLTWPLSAVGDYVLTPLCDGQSTATVAWGETFVLDFVLTSDASDVHNSAIFQVVFTSPGLTYTAYDWASPYDELLSLDDSTPPLASLPLTIDQDVFVNPVQPTLVDVELSNALVGSTFGTGALVSLTLTVPAGSDLAGSVYIVALPDTFADGFDEIPAIGGTPFELLVIPEPSSALALLAAALLLRRRSPGA